MKKKIILGILALVVIGGIYGASQGSKNDVKVTTSQNTEKKEEKKDEKKEEKAAYEVTDVKVEKDEFSTYVTGILKNNTDKEKSYVQITFPVNDKDGNKVGTALANVNNLGAGKTWKFKAVYFGSEKEVKIEIENPEVSGF